MSPAQQIYREQNDNTNAHKESTQNNTLIYQD